MAGTWKKKTPNFDISMIFIIWVFEMMYQQYLLMSNLPLFRKKNSIKIRSNQTIWKQFTSYLLLGMLWTTLQTQISMWNELYTCSTDYIAFVTYTHFHSMQWTFLKISLEVRFVKFKHELIFADCKQGIIYTLYTV